MGHLNIAQKDVDVVTKELSSVLGEEKVQSEDFIQRILTVGTFW